MEFLIVLFLIILNGLFAMSEIAIISARRHRLQQKANEGSKRAQAALAIASNPNRFLSTVQVGITLIGILAGAFGGATIAKSVGVHLHTIPLLAPYSDGLSIALVVGVITYLSVIIGEIVPKRIALHNPEAIAIVVARPMNVLSSITAPVVEVLSMSTDWILNLMGIKQNAATPVSEEEIRMMIREGARVGVFEVQEKDIIERTFTLGDKKRNSMMTAEKEIICLDINSSLKAIRNKIIKNPHPHYPVCKGNIDKIIGIVRTEDLLTGFLADETIEITKAIHKPLFIPESMAVLKVLELFKKSGIHIALVVDEYGNVQGLLSLTDILEAIVGDIPTVNELEEKEIIKRDNNSWYIDGLLSVDEFKEHFRLKKLSGEKSGSFHTLGGFVMHKLGRIPVSGDNFEYENYRFDLRPIN